MQNASAFLLEFDICSVSVSAYSVVGNVSTIVLPLIICGGTSNFISLPSSITVILSAADTENKRHAARKSVTTNAIIFFILSTLSALGCVVLFLWFAL